MHRYIPNGDDATQEMLDSLGIASVEALFRDIPEALRFKGELNLEPAKSELEVLRYMQEMAGRNTDLTQLTSFMGAGVYDHYVPGIIKHITSRSEFYTAYTPYQPEISQGTLQVIFEYQSMICELTGMDVSNASMYDGATAATEAVLMATTHTKRKKVLVARALHPDIRTILDTYTRFRGIEVIELAEKDGLVDLEDLQARLDKDVACVLLQSPNFFGLIENVEKAAALAKEVKALTILSVDPISLALLKSPGEMGVDIVVGDGQSLGNGTNYGGPYLGFMAVTKPLMRKLPGRIAGQTVDTEGKRAWVLTLQAREQHIRRFKATSNICSNQGLNALITAIYLTTMGKEGLREVAMQSMQKAHYAQQKLIDTGKFQPAFPGPFFKEFALTSDKPVAEINAALLEQGILGGYDLSECFGVDGGILLAVTEKRTQAEIDRLAAILEVM